MRENKDKKGVAVSILCVFLMVSIWFVYSDLYKKLPVFQKNVITIGVFSDSYWEVQNGYSYRILEDALEVFQEQHKGIQVEYVSGILKEDYSEWLSEQLLLGTAPDVFFVLPEDFGNLAEIGALADLKPLVLQDTDFMEEQFYSSAYEFGKYNGIQYALPYECAPKLMFVNKSILKREGVVMPDIGWTWDDFYDICKKVTKDTTGNGVLDQFGVTGYTWEDAFESNGVQLFDSTGEECYFSDSRAGTALEFIEKMNGLSSGYNTTARDFDLGNVAFQPMLFSEYRAYKPYPLSIKKYSGFEWECIPMPCGPDGDNISTLDTLCIAMNHDTKMERYAWDLMKILTSHTQIQSEIFEYSEGVSVLKEVTKSDETLSRLIESSGDGNRLNLEILSDAVEHAVVVPKFRKYEEAVLQVEYAVADIMESSANIRMEQIIWNRKLNKYLKN